MKDVSPAEEDVFNTARRIADGDARRAYVEQACGDDAALLARVRALLEAHDQTGGFLGSPAGRIGLTPQQRAALAPALPGSTVGRYALLQLIGEGAFGWVYKAEQRHPVRRTAALKVLKAGMETPQVVARFEAECQALALMDHPNIAKVVDTGATDAGRPYFVMELVEGTPITRYCDEQRLSPRQRLELFVQVCHAVQHAHQKGIIHRDLKPSNVLVAVYDGKPVPKVIDFGVAKATGPSLLETMHTGVGQMIGTLEYMSPEQAELNRADIDTRSDIYSLGVLLYELLTGTTPLEGRRLKEAPLLDALRVIREEEPPKPSTRLGTIAAVASDAIERGMEPQKLSRWVRGELDWVVMKCLEKDRSRRYETASGLAHDIERHLNDEPVAARPPGGAYRLRKFVRRHSVGVTAGVAVALALVIGTGVAIGGMVRAMKAQTEEAKQRADADAARADAEGVNKFLIDMLKWPIEKGGDHALVRDMLDAAAKELDEGSLKSQPGTEASVRVTLGRAYRSLSSYTPAEDQHRRALALRRTALGEDHPAVAESLHELAETLVTTGDVARAEPLALQAVSMRRRLFPGSTRLGASVGLLAKVHYGQGRVAEAEALYREAVAIRRRRLPLIKLDLATSLQDLAITLRRQGRLADAEPLYLEAVDLMGRSQGETSQRTVQVRAELARLYFEQSRFDEGERVQREVHAWYRAHLGEFHVNTNAALRALDLFRMKQGRLDLDALRSEMPQRLRSTIAAATAELERTGTGSPRATTVFAARGHAYAQLESFEGALADYTRLVELDPSDHFGWFKLTALLARLGEREKYAKYSQSALERFGGTTERRVAERLARMIGCVPAEFSGEDPRRVDELADRAFAGGTAHLNMKSFELTKGIADYRAGRFASAVRWLRKAGASAPGWHATQANFFLAMALERLGQREEALAALRKASEEMDAFPWRIGRTDTGQKHDVTGLGWSVTLYLSDEYASILHCELARDEAEKLLGVRRADGTEGKADAKK